MKKSIKLITLISLLLTISNCGLVNLHATFLHNLKDATTPHFYKAKRSGENSFPENGKAIVNVNFKTKTNSEVKTWWTKRNDDGTTSLEKGGDAVYKPSSKMIQDNPLYSNYNGVIDPNANNIGLANMAPSPDMVGQPIINYSNNPFTSNFWRGFMKEGGFISDTVNQLGGMNSMSLMHDSWGQNILIQRAPILQITIAPAIAIEYCTIAPAACGIITNELIGNDNFEQQ